MKPRAYSYIRFSSPEQAKGDSLRRQIHLAVEYTERHGLELDTDLTFQDQGLSAYHGANISVGRLGEFKRAVEDGIVPVGSYLLIEDLDRMSRQAARRAVRTLEDICELGVTVVTLSDGKAYTAESLDGMDFILSLVMFMRAHEESKLKAKRIRSSWKAKREKIAEKPLTAKCPAWLRLVDGVFEVIPERAAIVQRIFKEFLNGCGSKDIAARLNREGVPAITNGLVWYRAYIDKILSNGMVIGTLTPHSGVRVGTKIYHIPLDPIEGYYPAIITLKLYERVQHILSKSLNGRKSTVALKNIFAYVAKCSICGTSMMFYSNRVKNKWAYLICRKARLNGCIYIYIPYNRLEYVFINVIRESLFKFPNNHMLNTYNYNTITAELLKLKELKDIKSSLLEEIDIISDSTSKRNNTLAQQLIILLRDINTVERKISNLRIERNERLPDMVNMLRKELIEEINKIKPHNGRINFLISGLINKIELYKEGKANKNVRFVVTYKAGPVLECHYDDDSYQWRYLNISDYETAIADNVQWEDVNPVDLEEVLKSLEDKYEYTDMTVGNIIGESHPTVKKIPKRPKRPAHQKTVDASDKAIKLIETIDLNDLGVNKEEVETKLRELLSAIQNKLDSTSC